MVAPIVSELQPRGGNGDPFLDVQDVRVRFGGVVALDGPSFDVAQGQVCGLIGPNGAGKTTLFNCVSRIYVPNSGSIRFRGEDLSKVARSEIVGRGIARTFQNVALYSGLTVVENVMMGAHHRMKGGFLGAVFRTPAVVKADAALRADAIAALDELGLADTRDKLPSELPFGTLKRIELARAIVSRPQLLMLDEPANGLMHQEVMALCDLLLELKARHDLTILLVEHHMGMVSAITQKVVVLDLGRKLTEGTAAEVRKDPRVVEAYLGKAA
jgi:branched-chain amino acid transport system ATP-binding protein